ncbi:AlpA family transcriptional regulator [Vibrio aestuarianus]|uniref:AlpA family transcriptional regulator n=1 Tax=Vibrio aestuarianus TaxID=28171 RepID=UPI00237CFE56|nr:AlpA family transcriptional regulator [Vibrio aestuarianus]MDE1348529.1 AlpA family transcriptional regulator [Vibrio aestuarianus]
MRFIKLKEVMNITGLARATVYKHIKNGQFPKSVSLGERAVAWLDNEIDEWMLARIAQRDEAIEEDI